MTAQASQLFVQPNSAGQDLARRCVAIKFRTGKIGNSRKVGNSQYEVDADKDLLRVSKRLFDSAEFRDIKNFDHAVRAWLAEKALPFDTALHLIPHPLVEAVDAKMVEFAGQRAELVEKFLAVYPDLCEQAAAGLRSLYNPGDYPPVEYVRKQFSFIWQYVTFGTPDELKDISRRVWAEERTKAARVMEEAAEEIRQTLRAAMLELVETMRDRLDTPDGKPRIFAPACANLADFLGTFDMRNVADDDELKALVQSARALLNGVTPEALKTTAALRNAVRDGVARIADKLDGMIVIKPGRRIKLEAE